MKGIPQEYFDKLIPIKFNGLKIRIPAMYGAVLDWCYPGWRIPAGGSSSERVLCVVKKWGDKIYSLVNKFKPVPEWGENQNHNYKVKIVMDKPKKKICKGCKRNKRKKERV